MERRLLILVLFLCCGIGLQAHASEHNIRGPKDASQRERALDKLGYADIIWPRLELRKRGIDSVNIPPEYKHKVKKWLDKTIANSSKPEKCNAEKWNAEKWLGMPELDSNWNYIIGGWEVDDASVYFESTWSGISITHDSRSSIFKSPRRLTKEKIVGALQKVIKISDEQATKLTFTKHGKTIAGVPTCYGIFEMPGLKKHPDVLDRKWWWRIGYMITNHKVHVGFSIVNWRYPPASGRDRWHFKQTNP